MANFRLSSFIIQSALLGCNLIGPGASEIFCSLFRARGQQIELRVTPGLRGVTCACRHSYILSQLILSQLAVVSLSCCRI